MQELIKYASIVLCFYFIFQSFKKPIALFFVYLIFDSYFFGMINVYSITIKIIPKITLYLDDLVKIVIIVLLIMKWEKLRDLEYKRLFLILIFFFILFSIFRIVLHLGNLELDAIKNQLRLYSVFLMPMFFYLFLPEKEKYFFINSVIIIAIFSLIVFYMEYFGFFDKILHFGIYQEKRIEWKYGIERINISNTKFLMGISSLFLLYFFIYKKIKYLIIWNAILITFFLTTYRASFLVIFLTSILTLYFILGKSYNKNIKYRFILLFIIIVSSIVIVNLGVFDLYIERIVTAFTDLRYDEGTARVRIIKTFQIMQLLSNNQEILIFGSILSTIGTDVAELIALDLGIIDTIATNGIIFTFIFLMLVFNIYTKLNSQVSTSILVKALILGSIPFLIFNFEPISYTVSTILPLYGYYLAELRWNEDKIKKG